MPSLYIPKSVISLGDTISAYNNSMCSIIVVISSIVVHYLHALSSA